MCIRDRLLTVEETDIQQYLAVKDVYKRQRRSVAVKKALNVLGVQDEQIETVSYGEEKSVGCADEACFSKDRRADIVYQGE